MLYEISYTKPNARKNATFGYKVLRTEDIDEFVNVINTHATCPAVFKDGHRRNANITEIFGWLRYDADEEGEADLVESRLSDHFYIKKPSTRNEEYPYKWHFLVAVSGQSNDPAQFKDQCRQASETLGIQLKDMAVTSVTGAVQNMNAYLGEDYEAEALTTVHRGETLPLPAPKVSEGEYDHTPDTDDGFTNLDDAADTGVYTVDGEKRSTEEIE
ncbi:MAG: hypothetical protein B5M52_05190, partial [Helicobacteraceae bacterium 4484_230]